MWVLREAGAGVNPVLIDHAECAKAHLFRMVVIGEGKRVARIKPAMIGVTPVSASSDRNHHLSCPDLNGVKMRRAVRNVAAKYSGFFVCG
jgi:hypothetical protein